MNLGEFDCSSLTRRSLTLAPMGMAAAASWRCQEPQSFGRADSASIHWAMESSSTQLLTYFQTETELKQSSNKLKPDAALMAAYLFTKLPYFAAKIIDQVIPKCQINHSSKPENDAA